MSYSITYALLSLLFAGINDVVFKRYSSKDRSRGTYIFGIGVIWTVLQVLTFRLRGVPLAFDSFTLGFGLTAGFFLTLSNILLLESLTHIDASLGSTIYRLNTVGVLLLSVLFLHEPLGLWKVFGILCGILAVLLLYQRDLRPGHNSRFLLFFILAMVASLFRAAYGVSTKAGILGGGDANTMLLFISSSWILGGIGYAALRERQFQLDKKQVTYSLMSGILVFLIVNFLMLAVQYGQASIVIPIANMSFVVTLFLSRIMKMETFTFKKLLAIGCAAGSIILLSQA